jgi:anthranilate phosphoribosyltransferase
MDNKQIFDDILSQKLSSDDIKKFLIKLYNQGASQEHILQATKAMRKAMSVISLDGSTIKQDNLFDIVGTGGDSSNSINISSTSSILLSACGVSVAKHGSISATSASGSANMLEALGININLSDKQIVKMLEITNYAFIFAKNFHPALAPLAPIRKSISHGTIFNILGPLCNPLRVKKMLLGVYDKNLMDKMVNVFLNLGGDKILCVHSKDGLDEISLSSTTYALLASNSKDNSQTKTNFKHFEINPQEYGFKLYSKDDIKGGNPEYNAKITRDILSGDCVGAKRNIVVLNTAFGLIVDGIVSDISDGVKMANEAIDSKKALKHLELIIKTSNSVL